LRRKISRGRGPLGFVFFKFFVPKGGGRKIKTGCYKFWLEFFNNLKKNQAKTINSPYRLSFFGG